MKFSLSGTPNQRVTCTNQHMPLRREVGHVHWSLGNHQISVPWSIHLHPCSWHLKWIQLVLGAVVFVLKVYYLFLAMLSVLLLAASDLQYIEWPTLNISYPFSFSSHTLPCNELVPTSLWFYLMDSFPELGYQINPYAVKTQWIWATH